MDQDQIEERVNNSRDFWSRFYEFYQKFISPNFYAHSQNLYHLISDDLNKIQEGDHTIMEIGCGDGTNASSLFLKKQPESKLIVCDLTPKMVALTSWKMRQIENVLSSNPPNPKDFLGIEAKINKVPNSDELLEIENSLNAGNDQIFEIGNAVAKIGNNLELIDKVAAPNSINSLVSSLSLHIVPDPDLMLRQCLGVLKPGGKASFSVWGEKTPRNYFEIMDEALCIAKKQPYRPIRPEGHSHWDLGDRNILISKMENAGFVHVTVTQQFIPFKKITESEMEDFLEMTINRAPDNYAGIEEEVKRVYKAIYDQIWYGDQQLVGFNILYAIGTKPASLN